jgi:RNA polymerase sigma-70 factor (ECF subfamily)
MEIDLITLIERAKSGDCHAFSQLYSQYSIDMYRLAVYMMGNKDDAEDAVQEALLSAWKNIHNLREDASFKVWLFKILSNRCKTELMKRNKVPDTLPIDEYDFLSDSNQDDGFTAAQLKEALLTLTPPDAQIIMLSVIGGFKSYEIAEIYNMESGTVRSRQKRALEKLREILS